MSSDDKDKKPPARKGQGQNSGQQKGPNQRKGQQRQGQQGQQRQGQQGARQRQNPPPAAQSVAGPARPRRRHFKLALFFLLWVVAPLSCVVGYLYWVAHDQYASYVGFTVRSEEVSSGIEILGGITDLSGSSTSDTEILYKFINSRQMVEAVNRDLDLASIYENPDDPVFGMPPDGTIEDMQAYWRRVVKIYFDTRSGLLELRIVAFAPEDAQRVAQHIVSESTSIINELTAIAREDTTRYAREVLDRTIERLKEARQAINTFRARTQIVDPLADTQGHLGLLNNLQTQLAMALIELDMVRQTARSGDPRITQGERKVQVIEARISEERNRFGSETETEDDTYSRLVGEYEELAVELEFANSSYLSALAAYDSALAEAQRKSRYVAAYQDPTLAQSAEYPQRFLISALTFGALLLSFMILCLVYYSLRDRQ
jgi:capsular polysaccharide transport system permease protein